MKVYTLIVLLWLSNCSFGQIAVTTDLGAVGALRFSITKTDSEAVITIMQNSADTRIVVIPHNEIDSVVQTLNYFSTEVSKKHADKTVITQATKSLMLSCSYFKASGWLIMIQNTDPVFEQNSETIRRKTGYQVHNFVEIKPKHLKEAANICSKAAAFKAK